MCSHDRSQTLFYGLFNLRLYGPVLFFVRDFLTVFYLDVLGREADPEGLRFYRGRVMEKNWNEGDVRDALRKSEEYRKTGGRP